MNERASAPPLPNEVLSQLLAGKWLSAAVSTAAELGIPDQLKEGPRTPAEIATSIGLHAPSVSRLLRALASVGVFAETGGGRFGLTPPADLLRSDHPASMRNFARMVGLEEFSWRPWGALHRSLRTGKPAFVEVHGESVFDYLGHHPSDSAIFDGAMTGYSIAEAAAIVRAYPFGGQGTVVDVGGGHGVLLSRVLEANPGLRGVLYDLAHVAAGARARLGTTPSRDRVTVQEGSFFDGVPSGGDIYMMKHIIHDWSDDHCLRILGHCRRAIGRNGRLLVLEMVVPPGNDPHPSKLLDLEMLVMTDGGKERTEAEFGDLFARAGFRLARIVRSESPICVLEGLPA